MSHVQLQTSKSSKNSKRPVRMGHVLALAVGSLCAQMVRADVTWTGATNTDWSTTTNWSSTPSGQNLQINTNTGNIATITASPSFTPIDIKVGIAGFTGRVDETAGTVNTGTGNWLIVGQGTGGVGTFNLADTATTGGTLTGFGTGSGSINVGNASTTSGRLVVGDGLTSVGTFNMNTTGTLKTAQSTIGVLLGNGGTSTGNFNLDNGILQINSLAASIGLLGGTNGSDGTFRQSGGTVSMTGGLWLGDNNINSQGVVTQTGGLFNGTANNNYIGRNLGQGTMTISGGTMAFSGATHIGMSTSATTGTKGEVNVTGGVWTNAGEVRIGTADANSVAATSSGVLNVSGGSVTVGALTVGRGNDAGDLSSGTINVSGGTLTSTGDVIFGFAGAGNMGRLTVSGGTVNFGTTATKWIMMGEWDTSNSQMDISAGNVNFNTNTELKFNRDNTVGTNTVNQTGGNVTFFNDNATSLGGTGGIDLHLSATGTTSTNTYNLDGGTLTVPRIYASNSVGTRILNLNGGLLKAAASNGNFINVGSGNGFAYVKAGGALIDSNGYSVTAVSGLLAPTTGLSGGLTKSGAGSLSLTGVSTYTGTTTISGGALILSGAGSINSTAALTVNGGAGTKLVQNSTTALSVPVAITSGGLDGTGSVGAVTIANGASNYVANGDQTTTNQLSVNDINFAGAGALNLRIAGGGTTAIPGIIDYGTLTGTGTSASLAVSVSPTSPLNLATAYALVYHAGGLVGGLSQFTYTGNTARTLGSFTDDGTYLYLTLNGDTPKWSGLDAGGEWKVGTTGANGNWKLVTGGTSTDYIEGDTVLFDDTATGTTTASITSATVAPAFTTFNNSTLNYTVAGTSVYGLGGTGPVLKQGTGTVTFTGNHGYTGATTINAGTLKLGDGTTDGDLTGTTGIINNGTLEVNRTASTTFTLGAPISGSGTLVKSGAGTQILTGSNTYGGGTTINAGTLQLNNTTAPASVGTFTLNGGKLLAAPQGVSNNFGWNPTINLNASATIGNGSTLAMSGAIQGQINFNGTVNGNGNTLVVANTAGPRFYVNGVLNSVALIDIQAGNVGFDMNSVNVSHGVPINVANGAAMWIAGNGNAVTSNITFNGGNGLNGNGALYYEGGNANPTALPGTITLAGGSTGFGGQFAADTVTLSGLVTGPGTLVKVSTDTYSLSGSNDYSGGSVINSGNLLANNNYALGTGAVTVNAVLSSELRLGNGVNVANALTINGGGATGQGALYVPTGDATYSGSIGITAATQAGGHFATGGGTLSLTGALTSAVPVTVRAGNVLFNNSSASYSLLSISGTALIGGDNKIPTTASISMGSSAAAVLDLNGYNQTVVGITKSTNAATVTNNSSTSASTLSTTATSTFAGVIADGNSKVNLNVASGELTLTGANSFTGDVTVNGTLLASLNNNAFAPTTSALGNPQTGGRQVIVNSGGVLSFTTGNILGSGGSSMAQSPILPITVNAGGTLKTAVGATAGPGIGDANIFGSINLNGGVFTIGNGYSTDYQAAIVHGNITVGGTTASTIDTNASNTVANGLMLGGATAGVNNITFNVADATSSAAADLTVSARLVDSAVSTTTPANLGGLSKTGPGTMLVSATNTYSGPTTVDQGLLKITGGYNPAVTGSASLTVTGSGAVTIDNSAARFTTMRGSTVNITNGATVTIDASDGDGAGAGVRGAAGSVSNLSNLTIDGTSKLDLKNNGLIIPAAGNLNGSAITVDTLRAAIIAGRGGVGTGAATWSGAGGIGTSVFAFDETFDSIGYCWTGDPNLLVGPTDINGEAYDSGDYVVKYCAGADADLNGLVDDTDVAVIGLTYDGGASTGHHWYEGDFNYDGLINDDDVAIIGLAYNPSATPLSPSFYAALSAEYGTSFASAFAAGAAGTVVPEPASLGLLAVGAMGLLRRRRK